MSKEINNVTEEVVVEAENEVTEVQEVKPEGFLTKVKRGAKKLKTPLVIAGSFVLGVITCTLVTKGSSYEEDYCDEDFDVEVEVTEE